MKKNWRVGDKCRNIFDGKVHTITEIALNKDGDPYILLDGDDFNVCFPCELYGVGELRPIL